MYNIQMSPFIFRVDDECGELRVEDSTYYTMKWFYPRKTKDGISFSDNNEVFVLEKFQEFIRNIENDINCVYRRDNEDILEYKDNTFRINPDTCQTGLNYDSELIDFRIEGHKKELIETLESMVTWFMKYV
jgi:hypothetical protein